MEGSLHCISQGLSPQAQAVLNRLPPEQRAMALQEANRLRGSAGTVQSNKGVRLLMQSLQSIKLTHLISKNPVRDKAEDQILILSELEFSVSEDLKLEKENLKTAKR